MQRYERQPHIYGAKPFHYRQGVGVASGEQPPSWSAELAVDPDYPYTLEEYRRDVRRWCGATKVTEERRGPMLALSLGGAARTLIDEIDDDLAVGQAKHLFKDFGGERMMQKYGV